MNLDCIQVGPAEALSLPYVFVFIQKTLVFWGETGLGV